MTQLSYKDRATIITLYQAGTGPQELAERFGIKPYYVSRYILRPAGITPRMGRPRITGN